MSLLTQEQIAKSEMIRETQFLRSELSKAAANDCQTLLDIIDDLQARGPKQYTEQELREWFENRPLVQDEIDALLHEVVPGENEAWYSVLKFAAHVGALKAEP